jgi:hypothetical protein
VAQTRVADWAGVTEGAPDLVRFKPRRSRVVCWASAAAVVAVFTAVSFGLRGPTGDGPGVFEAGDQWAMIGLGVLAAGGILLFTRPSVAADRNGVRVRNVIGGYDLPWEVVRAVRFGRGAAWATLDLRDDDVVAVMAVQAADKEYALTAVRALRALHAAHAAPAHGD